MKGLLYDYCLPAKLKALGAAATAPAGFALGWLVADAPPATFGGGTPTGAWNGKVNDIQTFKLSLQENCRYEVFFKTSELLQKFQS